MLWPFKKRTIANSDKARVVPPVDLNTPVENPKLVAAMDVFHGDPSQANEHEMLRQLDRANFLVASIMDESTVVPGQIPGQASIRGGSKIGFLTCADDRGNTFLALFTDWGQINGYAKMRVSGMVMPAQQAWSFVLRDLQGAVVNPGGKSLLLTAEVVKRNFVDRVAKGDLELLSEDDGVQVFRTNEATAIQTKVARGVPVDLQSAIRSVCERHVEVQACMLLDCRKPNSDDGNISLLVNVMLRGDAAFQEVSREIITVLAAFPDWAAKSTIVSDDSLAKYLPDAIFRR